MARKFYIVRGVDKGQIKDGVKFWRFPHNKRNEGNYNKLIAAIQQFMNEHKIDFTNVNEGCDFSIISNNAEFNGVEYKKVTSIMPSGKIPLHPDPVTVRSLLEDEITWRDVYKPVQMRVLSSEEYLERIVKGTNPYWDDTDKDNKKWVFPDPMDKELEIKANTRDENLDANNNDKYYEQASDLVDESYSTSSVNINDVTKEDVGSFNNNGVEVGTPDMNVPETEVSVASEQPSVPTQSINEEEDFDDLPF